KIFDQPPVAPRTVFVVAGGFIRKNAADELHVLDLAPLEPRPHALELLGQAVLPHVRRLDHVVVDGNDLRNDGGHAPQATTLPNPASAADQRHMSSATFGLALEYLHRIGARDVSGATNLLDVAVESEGIGAINDSLADVCRSLMDRVVFPA